MKFSKTAQLVLAIGIFAVGFIFLYKMQQQRQADTAALKTQVEANQLLVPKLTADNETLQTQLDGIQANMETATASLKDSQTKYPASVDNISYAELLLKLAGDRNLEPISLTSAQPTTQTIDNVPYTVTTFTLELQGQVTDMLDYVNVVATSPEFASASVGPVNISVPKPLTKAESEAATAAATGGATDTGEEAPSAPTVTLTVDIYSYGEF